VYGGTGVVQLYRVSTGIVQVYRLQDFLGIVVVQEYRSITGVQGYRSTRELQDFYRSSGEVLFFMGPGVVQMVQ